jgi:ribosomal protein S21
MADLKRKKGESFEAFLRRFKSSLKNNKRLESFRSKQNFKKGKTKVQFKKSALARVELGKKCEILRKTGKREEGKRHRRR